MRKWAKLYATGNKFGSIGKERKEVNPINFSGQWPNAGCYAEEVDGRKVWEI
jgi:hypothetical protein